MADFLNSRAWHSWQSHPSLRPTYDQVASHSIWKALLEKPLTQRARTRIFYALMPSQRPYGLHDLTYDQFLAELKKPYGGRIGLVHHIGDKTIEHLRQICLDDDPLK